MAKGSAKKRTSEPRKGNGGPSTAALPFAVPSWPATTTKLLPLREIIPYERNPRTHPPAQIALLAELMRRHGVDQPIVVDERGVILKGHGRLAAAELAGFETFPVVRHVGLSEDEKRALRIADNQVALLSGWDPELLRGELGELKAAGFNMPLLGFEETKLVQFLTSPTPPSEFSAFGEDIEVNHECPRCHYRWSGPAKAAVPGPVDGGDRRGKA